MTAIEHRSAPTEGGPIVSGQLRSLSTGRRALGLFALVLPPILAGYALLDRGFAYIHIPPIPLFLGEFLVGLGLVVALAATGYVHRALQHSTAAKLLVAFCLWGVMRTVPFLGTFGFNAVRDAALWYYSLVAIPICALLIWRADVLPKWAGYYRRFIPWLLAWFPAALLLGSTLGTKFAITVPGGGASLWDHKPGNIAVQVAIALAFLWLVPGAGGKYRPFMTGVATLILLVVFSQNRGGFIAASAGLVWVWFFAKRRGRMTLAIIATVAILLVTGWATNIQIKSGSGRTISVNQIIDNVDSITGGGAKVQSDGNLDATVQFRKNLWSAVVTKVKKEKKVLTGLGFGRDIAKEVGFEGGGDTTLRSPHNSHVDVFARMGVIGLSIWIAFWALFFITALRTRARLRKLGLAFEMGLIGVCIAGVTAILVNAYFDPTLESPQVAIWLWTLVGVGFGLTAISRRVAIARHEAELLGADLGDD
jgi:hypothetical protein